MGIRAPLAFTLPGGEAQEDGASRTDSLTQGVHQNPGWGAGKPCPLVHNRRQRGLTYPLQPSRMVSDPHWTTPDHTGETCLILRENHGPRDSQKEDLGTKKDRIWPCSWHRAL